ncbi:MAG: hypothetical protein JW822_04160 [Spirochaetales bacterium]|nr:hypothetical protein [Spirochaetales bacterium]
MYKYLLLCVLPLTLLACVNIQTIPTAEIKISEGVMSEPIAASDVIVYRSVKPGDMSRYLEIGIVVLRGDNPELDIIFKLIRDEAAKQGAVYVVDFKLKCNPETRSMVVTNFNPDGSMTTSVMTYEVIAYTATGTLLSRRK